MRLSLLVLSVALVAGPRAVAAQAPDGQALYSSNCKRCHGARGAPPQTMRAKFPKIRTLDSAFVSKVTDDSLVTVLRKGKGEDMKSFADKLNAAEMAAVVRYVRSMAMGVRAGSD
jgi:mono/diheme cytochrome c family protein